MSRDTTMFMADQIERDREVWKVEPRTDMARRDVEDLINRGLGHFWVIRLADETWTARVQDGREVFDAEVARGYTADYLWWLAPCDGILARLDELERKVKVDRAEAFRDCVRMAKRLVSFDVEELIASVGEAELVPFPAGVEVGDATAA